MITYRKTKTGEWVVFGPTSELTRGPVTVSLKIGGVKTEHVERLGKPFMAGGVECAYGYLAPKTGSSRSSSSTTTECDECGRTFRGRGTKCYDSSGIPGVCCPECARMSSFERSFA